MGLVLDGHKLHDVMQQAIDARGSHTLRERVEYCWLHLGGPYCYATHAELENADAFFDLLDSLEQDSSQDLITRLEEGLQDLYARSSPSRLQLMTIHQAKGLEFDVVILPGLHRTPRQGDKPLIALQEFRTLDGHDAALVAGLPARGHAAPSVYAYLNAVNEERSAFETQRLLYVAATRAKQRLHVLGKYRRSKQTGKISAPRGTFMHMLFPAFLEQIDDRFEGTEVDRETKPEADAHGHAITLVATGESTPVARGFEGRNRSGSWTQNLPNSGPCQPGKPLRWAMPCITGWN